jgi:alkanesulfonate monooxygenase SsuD/methylene tetrahydromethanopterin reductase-like flavin-dependent oxidoreductase (luciferase family)
MGHALRGPQAYFAPPGYVSRIAVLMTTRRRPKPLNQLSYQELQDANHLIVGSPETAIKRLRQIRDRLGIGGLVAGSAGGSDVPSDHHAVDRSPRP